LTVADWLVSTRAEPWLARAALEDDPSSLAAAERWRRWLDPDRAAAVLDQIALRRRARAKLGAWAEALFLTREGLEMATRAEVAQWRAARLAAAGIERVVDGGTGLGIDATACVRAGLTVRGYERDPVLARLAQANLDWAARARGDRARAGRPAGIGGRDPDARDLGGPGAVGQCATDNASAGQSAAEHGFVGRGDGDHDSTGQGRDDQDRGDPAGAWPRVDCREIVDWPALATPGDTATAWFLDPSRRTAAGPTWDPERLAPPWPVVADLLARADQPVVVKLGPGMPRGLIPPGLAAVWVSHNGELVELSLWSGWSGWPPGRSAVLLPGGHSLPGGGAPAADGRSEGGATAAENRSEDGAPAADGRSRGGAGAAEDRSGGGAPVADDRSRGGEDAVAPGPVGRFLWEPDPAVIRARATAELARRLEARPLARHIPYLSGDQDRLTPFARRFVVLERLDYSDRAVRAWVRRQGVGVLEIKTRGLDLDPARWRRRLGLKGPNRATVVCSPTVDGAAVLVVRRD
jgi:hypothetical protein